MAYATPTTTHSHPLAGLRGALRSFLAHLADSRKRAAAYRQTFDELDRMSDRDLADIGITRFMIADVAAEAASRA